MPVKIAITIGDPAGVGPEVVLQAVAKLKNKKIIPIIIGRQKVLSKYYPKLLDELKVINKNFDLTALCQGKYLYDFPLSLPLPKLGQGSILTGQESRSYLEAALKLWNSKKIDALVTGPVNKEFVQKTGINFRGHTEFLAESLGNYQPFMLMFSKKYRVLLVTTHLPLEKIRGSLTRKKIRETIEIGYESIKAIDGEQVKMAITSLDPHAGDNGAIGLFDKQVTFSVVSEMKKKGINISGPWAADTLFMKEKWSEYNLVIAFYHDQGLIPFKMLAFDQGVNVTLGLPLVRTSVDHGTAYDLAGKGIAQFKSMTEAIKLAEKLFKLREGTKKF